MFITFPVVSTQSWRSNVTKWDADRSLATVGNEEYAYIQGIEITCVY